MNINSLSEYEKSLLLQYYCLSGDVNGVRFALSQGADINRPNRDKVIPLYLACAIDHIDVVRLLVRCGADLLYRNPLYKNQNALEISQDRGSHKTVAFLKSVLHQNGKKKLTNMLQIYSMGIGKSKRSPGSTIGFRKLQKIRTSFCSCMLETTI